MGFETYCPTCETRYPDGTEVCPDDGSPLLRVPEEDLIGKTVDRRYRILEKVGEGGMGTVYKAVHQMLQREVALKVVRRDAVQDETAVKRFLTEARAIAALKNPHTVTIYDSGVTEDGALYYTMELLTGRPLSHLLRKEGAVDFRRAADLIAQVCESLEEAHAMGILHRDIKPDNIFLVREKGAEFAKLVDFGIAKVLGDVSDGALTRTGMLVGTPRYLSPEQVSGEALGPGADLYALGIVLYELLTGTPPFSGQTPAEIMMAHVQDMPEPIPRRNPGVQVPNAMDEVIRIALEKDPAKRFQTAAQFREALRAVVHGQSLETQDAPLLDGGLDATLDALETPAEFRAPREETAPNPVQAALDSAAATDETMLAPGMAQQTVTSPASLPTEDFVDPSGVDVTAPMVVDGGGQTTVVAARRPWWVWLIGVGALLAATPLAMHFFGGGDEPEAHYVEPTVQVQVATPAGAAVADIRPVPESLTVDVVSASLPSADTLAAPAPPTEVATRDSLDALAPTAVQDATVPELRSARQDVHTEEMSLPDATASTTGGDVEETPPQQPAQHQRVDKKVEKKVEKKASDDDWFDDVDKLPTE